MFHLKPITLNLHQADITYYPSFLANRDANTYLELLLQNIPWQHDSITVFGKTYPQPRLTALFSTTMKCYSYSTVTMKPHPFPSILRELKHRIEHTVQEEFTTCLANLYRDGNDSNGWHADNEKSLGKNPIIASLSLGQERYFHLKHRVNTNLKTKLLLEHGSLLLMKGETQHHWLHQIPKTKKTIGKRINLTFRVIK